MESYNAGLPTKFPVCARTLAMFATSSHGWHYHAFTLAESDMEFIGGDVRSMSLIFQKAISAAAKPTLGMTGYFFSLHMIMAF